MNLKVLAGVVLMVIGLVAAGAVIAGVGQRDVRETGPAVVEEAQEEPSDAMVLMTLAAIAGLSIAGGGALIGIGLGHFEHPKIVPANSPDESRAATTRGTNL